MSRANPAERCVFGIFYLVGNIPYGATEEDLRMFFEKVGPVVNFRLIRDKESNKPRGYGFCEFKEKEYARSAIRNMNGIEFNGRVLRVDYSEKHRNALSIPENQKPNTLQDCMSNLTGTESYFLMQTLQNFSLCKHEEMVQLFNAKPFLVFSLLKLMHRMNSEVAHAQPKVTQDGLLPYPEERYSVPYYGGLPR